jgi:hypothetical protein
MSVKIDIDLKDTQADSFYLISQAREICKKTGKDFSIIIKKMTSSDSKNLINIFQQEFGDYINLIYPDKKNN